MRKRTAFWVVHQFETLLTTAISYFFADRMIFTAMKIELSLCCLSGWLPPRNGAEIVHPHPWHSQAIIPPSAWAKISRPFVSTSQVYANFGYSQDNENFQLRHHCLLRPARKICRIIPASHRSLPEVSSFRSGDKGCASRATRPADGGRFSVRQALGAVGLVIGIGALFDNEVRPLT